MLVDVAKAETCRELTCYQFGRGALNVENHFAENSVFIEDWI